MKTSRYSNWAATGNENLVKVGVTAYPPRFKLRYPLAGNIGLIAPDKSMLGMHDREEFRVVYFAKLDGIGVAVIREALAKYEQAGKEIVLLCYENLTEGRWCHRCLFAEWWKAQTGEVIEELPDQPAKNGPKAPKKKVIPKKKLTTDLFE